jgi:hypothetical protein
MAVGESLQSRLGVALPETEQPFVHFHHELDESILVFVEGESPAEEYPMPRGEKQSSEAGVRDVRRRTRRRFSA